MSNSLKYVNEDVNAVNAECPKCGKTLRIYKQSLTESSEGLLIVGETTCSCDEQYQLILGKSAFAVPASPMNQASSGKSSSSDKKCGFILLIFIVGGMIMGSEKTNEPLKIIFGGGLIGAIFAFVFFLMFGGGSKKGESRQSKEQTRIREMSQLGIKCPTCSSNNIERISTAKKAAYVAAVGILAPAFKKVRSQFECKQCGYKW